MLKWLSLRRLLFAALLLAGVLSIPPLISREPAPIVRTVAVQSGPIVVEVTTNGTVEPIDNAEVRARLDGRIEVIPDPGTRVAAGDEILSIDSAPALAALETARSERLAAEESLRAARDALVRAREQFETDTKLFTNGALTRQRYRESEQALHEAEAQARFAEENTPVRQAALDARIADLQEQVAGAVVRAPFPGTIYKTEVKVGATVHTGDLVLAVTNLDRLRVRANIDQVDLGKVKAGQSVKILTNAHPGRKWEGKVTEVIPHVQLKQNRAISEALAEVTSPVEGLVPGMTVDVEVVVASAESALQIPSESVFNDDKGRSLAYAVDGSHVRARPIDLGLISATAVQVTNGLTAGTAVVLGPALGIHDGMRVRVEPADGG